MVKTSGGREEERERLRDENTKLSCSCVLHTQRDITQTLILPFPHSPIPILVGSLLEPVHADAADPLLEVAGEHGIGPVEVMEE